MTRYAPVVVAGGVLKRRVYAGQTDGSQIIKYERCEG
jgi:hypothetical protein